MKTSDSIDQLALAIIAAQAEIKPAPKDAINPHFKSRYADLAAVWEACQGPLSKHSLAVIQAPSMTENRLVRITTRLMHKSGQWLESCLDLKPMKDDPQAVGSAITYGRRYALAAIVGVVSEEDDDGNAASARPPQRPPQPPIPPKPVAPPPPVQPPQKVFFDKEKKEHIEYVMRQYESGVIPDGMASAVMEYMQGKEFNKASIGLALAAIGTMP